MTLSIADVAGWNPDQLTTASGSVGTLSTNLDQAVLDSVTHTQQLGDEQQWNGAAAQAATDRMNTEKSRASKVSQALLELQTALSQQVENLNNTKKAVTDARDRALHPAEAAPPPDAFEVADNGVVTAEARKRYWDNQSGLKPEERDQRKLEEDHRAGMHQSEITNALKQAEAVAEAAVQALNAAKAKVDQAYNELGDPTTGAGGATPAPAPTTPTASTAPNGSPSPSYTPTSGGGSSAGNGSHGGGSHQSSLYSGGGHSSGSYSGPTSGGPPSIKPSGDVAQWVAQAKQVLLEMGYRPDQIDEQALAVIIEKESGGNPNAINLTDSNAAAGHPSKGLMQTIDSTFSSYAAPGHTDIWNPVDNIVAGARYSIERYGSVRHPGVESYMSGGQYHGY